MRSIFSLSRDGVWGGSGDTTRADGEDFLLRLTSCRVGVSVSNSLVNIDPEPSCPCRPIRPKKCSNFVGVATITRLVSDLPGIKSTHNPATGPSSTL